MNRLRRAALALLLAVGAQAGSGPAQAGASSRDAAGSSSRDAARLDDGELRARVLEQLVGQQEALAQAAASVRQKLDEARRQQAARARAALRLRRPRVDRAPLEGARSRAASAWLLGRERSEVSLLFDELTHLEQAAARLSAATEEARTLRLPPRTLARPVKGQVARAFGRLTHERSGATLSRRGVDLEVDEGALATALADGTVVHAGPIRGLDDGVLVEHDGYFTLVAKLSKLQVSVGQRVDPGIVLGQAARRRVYVELRLRLLPSGLPVDPMPFFSDEP